MTAPLTPPESDLQDFPFMPLHVARLRDSDLAAEEKPEACWYAVLLWAAAWHQLPAGSLPDNDAVLAKLIGLGRDVRTFRKHRDGALRGFIKCTDGRLYHPIVAEQVNEAWERKLQQRWRSECARIKKANQRNGTNDPTPTYAQFLEGLSLGTEGPRPAPVPEDKPKCPSGQALQETGTGTYNSVSNETGASAPTDPDKKAWREAVDVLTAGKRMSEANARKFFGQLLSRNKLQAKDLLPALAQCVANGTEDPAAYVRKAAERLSDRRSGGSAPPLPLESDEPINWAWRLQQYRGPDRVWVESMWGPRPGQPGCLCPAELLEQA